MGIKTSPRVALRQGSLFLGEAPSSGNLKKKQTHFGTGMIRLFGQQFLSVGYWVPKGENYLQLRGFPSTGCGCVVWKSPFNIKVPIAFVIKATRSVAHTLFWLMKIHRRVQKRHRGEWAKTASTGIISQSGTSQQMPTAPRPSMAGIKEGSARFLHVGFVGKDRSQAHSAGICDQPC